MLLWHHIFRSRKTIVERRTNEKKLRNTFFSVSFIPGISLGEGREEVRCRRGGGRGREKPFQEANLGHTNSAFEKKKKKKIRANTNRAFEKRKKKKKIQRRFVTNWCWKKREREIFFSLSLSYSCKSLFLEQHLTNFFSSTVCCSLPPFPWLLYFTRYLAPPTPPLPHQICLITHLPWLGGRALLYAWVSEAGRQRDVMRQTQPTMVPLATPLVVFGLLWVLFFLLLFQHLPWRWHNHHQLPLTTKFSIAKFYANNIGREGEDLGVVVRMCQNHKRARCAKIWPDSFGRFFFGKSKCCWLPKASAWRQQARLATLSSRRRTG